MLASSMFVALIISLTSARVSIDLLILSDMLACTAETSNQALSQAQTVEVIEASGQLPGQVKASAKLLFSLLAFFDSVSSLFAIVKPSWKRQVGQKMIGLR